ncbi:helix-turn-helix domain-containing protein [Streptomyces sp. NPDC059340]|uniref:helix-turn-helix domain-containing protein n=1 Tax=Streptomyces sp. NPDC059340 TaxID=3346806 RepID=UPI00368D790A
MAEQRQRTDFFDLVRERRAELGISLRELEARAVDPESGEQAKRPWVSKVEKGTAEAPSEPMLRALAAGLNLPVRVVAEAASIQFFGMGSFVWSEDRTTRVLAARIEEMSDEERRQLAAIAETFARRRTRSEGNSED